MRRSNHMDFQTCKPHVFACIIAYVFFSLEKRATRGSYRLANCNGKVINQEMLTIGIVFCSKVSNDEVPEKSWNGMKASIQSAFANSRDVVMLKWLLFHFNHSSLSSSSCSICSMLGKDPFNSSGSDSMIFPSY